MEHIITAIVTLAVGFLIFEVYIWLPAARRFLTKLAARIAPKEDQPGLEEQWLADLEDMPNSIAMLATSIGFFFAAAKLNVPTINRIIDEWLMYKFLYNIMRLQSWGARIYFNQFSKEYLIGRHLLIKKMRSNNSTFDREAVEGGLEENKKIVLILKNSINRFDGVISGIESKSIKLITRKDIFFMISNSISGSYWNLLSILKHRLRYTKFILKYYSDALRKKVSSWWPKTSNRN